MCFLFWTIAIMNQLRYIVVHFKTKCLSTSTILLDFVQWEYYPCVIHLDGRQTPGCWLDSKLFNTRSKQLSASWVFLANLGQTPKKNLWKHMETYGNTVYFFIYRCVYVCCLKLYVKTCFIMMLQWLLKSFKISKVLKRFLKNYWGVRSKVQ